MTYVMQGKNWSAERKKRKMALSEEAISDALEELQEQTVEDLFDQIDLIESESDYEFIEFITDKLGRGHTLTQVQWARIQKLHSKYIK